MPNRRALALYTTLCLLVSLMAFPSGPTLVCRITGAPMVVSRTMGRSVHPPCCDVAVRTAADGASRYVLRHPGCCDLRQSMARASAPAITGGACDFPAVALTTTPILAPRRPAIDLPRISATWTKTSPRGPPPLPSASPRGPPIVS